MNERSIFLAALEKNPADRPAFLDDACRADAALREQVDSLLRAYDKARDFLGGSSAEQPTLDQPATDAVDGRIGPYKLLQQIGEGGMGTVWMAQQDAPVRRTVALKIIKPGMDSSQVIARFEAERQALALMDHPNIAKVLDAGTTESGRPYFVMELVRGLPITQYCDEQRLSPRERLQLMVPVCHAIQHAHQKGIIHRDIKPSNVLIAAYDGRPVPKVIDFGIAKAMGQKLTERTLFTGFGGLIGTLEYMSPEQAEFNALDIDTRSDVYSLGVLLYELLTGTTPLTKEQLKDGAIAELLRAIREDEPPRPSTRISQSSATLASISAQRRTEPGRLPKLVRGDLDWIVMKALEKERSRRYETATQLARDIERFLADETVEACPPSMLYRSRKLIRRHRGAALGIAAVVLSLLAGVVVSTWQAVRATKALTAARTAEAYSRQQQIEASQARVREQLAKDTAIAMAAAESQAKRDAVLALQKSQTQEAIAVEMNDLVFRLFSDAAHAGSGDKQLTLKSLLDDASARLDRQRKTHPLAEAKVLAVLALGYQLCQENEKSQSIWERAYQIHHEQLGDEDEETQKVMRALAHAYHWDGKFEQARPIYEKLLDVSRKTRVWDYQGLLYELGFLYQESMEYAAAEKIWLQFIESGDYSAPNANAMVVKLMSAQAKQQLGQCYRDQGQHDAAEPLLLEALAAMRSIAGEGGTVFILAEIGRLRLKQQDFTEAETQLQRSLQLFQVAQQNDWRKYDAMSLLGAVFLEQEKYVQAEPLLIQGYQGMDDDLQKKMSGQGRVSKEMLHRKTESLERLVKLYQAWNKPEEATKWQQALNSCPEN